MPIYEYKCTICHRRTSVFYRTFQAAEDGDPGACPRCGSQSLSRLMSRVSIIKRTGHTATDQPLDDEMAMPGEEMLGPDLDNADPRAIARWARQMSDTMGEPMEPGFDEALTRIEAGDDPDQVMHDLDTTSGDSAPQGADPTDD